MNKAVYSILSIDTFEQQYVLMKCMLQSSRLEDHMKTIGIDQSLCTRSSFEHKCMNNIKKIYQHAGKCDDQKTSRVLLILIWCLLQRDSHMEVLIFLWHQQQSKNQVLGNHCVYSPTYWMLNRKHKNVVLWLQNPNAEP